MRFVVAFLLAMLVFFVIDFVFYSLNRKHNFNSKTTYNIGQCSGILVSFLIFLIYELI